MVHFVGRILTYGWGKTIRVGLNESIGSRRSNVLVKRDDCRCDAVVSPGHLAIGQLSVATIVLKGTVYMCGPCIMWSHSTPGISSTWRQLHCIVW